MIVFRFSTLDKKANPIPNITKLEKDLKETRARNKVKKMLAHARKNSNSASENDKSGKYAQTATDEKLEQEAFENYLKP